MFVECIENACHFVTGDKVFTKGNLYPTKVCEEDERFLLALDDQHNWTSIARKEIDGDFLDNTSFQFHFRPISSFHFEKKDVMFYSSKPHFFI